MFLLALNMCGPRRVRLMCYFAPFLIRVRGSGQLRLVQIVNRKIAGEKS
jgi:hypothetical protein